MIKVANNVIIVADHTKFGRDAMIHVAGLNEVDCVISDDALKAEFREMLKANGVDCVTV
jgi:DeoR/GlpR family transcriptional regulator of sugar metabolism